MASASALAMTSKRSIFALAPSAWIFRRSSSRGARSPGPPRSRSTLVSTLRASFTLRPSDATKSARAPPSLEVVSVGLIALHDPFPNVTG